MREIKTLMTLNENDAFVEMLKWGVIELRVEHYENVEMDKMLDQKICSTIEDAIDFVKSNKAQAYVFVDGGRECLNILDIA